MDADARRPKRRRRRGTLNADTCGKGGGESKIGKILCTSFMDGPLTKHSVNSTGISCPGIQLPELKNGKYETEYKPKTKITVKCDPG